MLTSISYGATSPRTKVQDVRKRKTKPDVKILAVKQDQQGQGERNEKDKSIGSSHFV